MKTKQKRARGSRSERKIDAPTGPPRSVWATIKGKIFTAVDPGTAAICAALLTASATTITNLPKMWPVDTAAGSIESHLSEKDKRYIKITEELAERRGEISDLKKEIQQKKIPAATRKSMLAAIDEYEAANREAKERLNSHHASYKTEATANDWAGADQHEELINESLTKEASRYIQVLCFSRDGKMDCRPYSMKPPVRYLTAPETEPDTLLARDILLWPEGTLFGEEHEATLPGEPHFPLASLPTSADDPSDDVREGLSPR